MTHGNNKILEEFSLYVMPRDNEDPAKTISDKTESLKKDYGKIKSISYANPFKTLSISATDIRKILSEGETLPDGLVTKNVENYIFEKKIYQ